MEMVEGRWALPKDRKMHAPPLPGALNTSVAVVSTRPMWPRRTDRLGERPTSVAQDRRDGAEVALPVRQDFDVCSSTMARS